MADGQSNILPLEVANPIEAERGWEDFCKSPADLLQYIIRSLGVKADDLIKFNTVIVSSAEPQGEDREKLWLKSSNPPGLGIPIGGSYEILYPYPVDIPFLWVGGADLLPDYANPITDSQLEDMGITKPTNDSYIWYLISA